MHSPDRRAFLAASAATLAVPAVTLAANEKLNIGLIGSGNRGRSISTECVKAGHNVVATADCAKFRLDWIAAELGWIAFAVYVIANVSLGLMGWRALKRARTAAQQAAAGCFLALVAAYWITGLTLTSGLYSDLNLYFFFLLGLLSNRFESRSGPIEMA